MYTTSRHSCIGMKTVINLTHRYVHTLQEGYWASISSDSDGVAFHYCPPGYCRCDKLVESDDPTCFSVLPEEDIDLQCVCDRKGKESTLMMTY